MLETHSGASDCYTYTSFGHLKVWICVFAHLCIKSRHRSQAGSITFSLPGMKNWNSLKLISQVLEVGQERLVLAISICRDREGAPEQRGPGVTKSNLCLVSCEGRVCFLTLCSQTAPWLAWSSCLFFFPEQPLRVFSPTKAKGENLKIGLSIIKCYQGIR